MEKKIGQSAHTYLRNVGVHVSGVLKRRESVKQALAEIRADTRKLTHVVRGERASDQRHEAVRLTKRGREDFNKKNYTSAEDRFRRAIDQDPDYALAHTYLGHVLYKLGRPQEAVQSWHRAIAVDPQSEAAAKAQEKLERVEGSRSRTVKTLEDRIRRKS